MTCVCGWGGPGPCPCVKDQTWEPWSPYTAPTVKQGWQCPLCNTVHSPDKLSCQCQHKTVSKNYPTLGIKT